jgi:hypothetical protein
MNQNFLKMPFLAILIHEIVQNGLNTLRAAKISIPFWELILKTETDCVFKPASELIF